MYDGRGLVYPGVSCSWQRGARGGCARVNLKGIAVWKQKERLSREKGKREVSMSRQRVSYPCVTGGAFLPDRFLIADFFCRFIFGAAGSAEVEVPVAGVLVSVRLRDPLCVPAADAEARG